MNTQVGDVLFDSEVGTFVQWKLADKSSLVRGSVMLEFEMDGRKQKMRSKLEGIADRVPQLLPGDKLSRGQLLLRIRRCDHSVLIKDMCADCGKDLRPKDGLPGLRSELSNANVAMIHHVPELVISQELATKQGQLDQDSVIGQRKLFLLVDLDQTLIHTTNESIRSDLEDVCHYCLYGPGSPMYHTRLRPHTKHFLKSMSTLYEMHICTFGQRRYAHRIAQFLDHDGSLFGQRILSRDECFDPELKAANLKALFPCGDQLTAIIDDREDVWQNAPNLIHVKPYCFFKHTGDINAPHQLAKTDDNTEHQYQFAHPRMEKDAEYGGCEDAEEEKGNKEQDEQDDDDDDDDYLLHLEDILTKVHRAFYTLFDSSDTPDRPDLKTVIPYVKSKVLRGVRLVFSGVISMNVQPETTHIYRVALAFGATVQPIVDKTTTHVVAARWGTNKVHQARRMPGVRIVTPHWLWCCVERWERVDEKLFGLAKEASVAPMAGQSHLMRRKSEIPPEKTGPSPTEGVHIGDLPTLSTAAIRRMTDEVDDALDEDDDDEDKSLTPFVLDDDDEAEVSDDEDSCSPLEKKRRLYDSDYSEKSIESVEEQMAEALEQKIISSDLSQ